MSLVCPSCHSEFRKGFETCASCDVALVSPESLASESPSFGAPREALKDKTKVVLPQGNLSASREMERALLEGGIVCYVHAEEADMDVALGSSAAMKYGVVIDENDVDRVRGVLKENFASLVGAEGQGIFNSEAIDLSADEIKCPACGHEAALDGGECAECGLFLGAPE